MTIKVHTGGLKEFEYSNRDLARQRSEDTPSTRNFKDAYHKYYNEKRIIQSQHNEIFPSIEKGTIIRNAGIIVGALFFIYICIGVLY